MKKMSDEKIITSETIQRELNEERKRKAFTRFLQSTPEAVTLAPWQGRINPGAI